MTPSIQQIEEARTTIKRALHPVENEIWFPSAMMTIDRTLLSLRRSILEEAVIQLPPHAGELLITHNAHKSNYETVEQHLEWMKADAENFVSPQSYKNAIATNELWECQWYPDTPVGFHKIYAATLPELLLALKAEGANKTAV